MFVNKCTHPSETYMKFCPECGVRTNHILCNCGATSHISSQYCHSCGQALEAAFGSLKKRLILHSKPSLSGLIHKIKSDISAKKIDAENIKDISQEDINSLFDQEGE